MMGKILAPLPETIFFSDSATTHAVVGPDASLSSLKKYTPAKISLERTGNCVSIRQQLEMKMAHAHARDAVYSQLDLESIESGVKELGLTALKVGSRAAYREEYLRRPDKGRQLDEASAKELESCVGSGCDIAVLLADGLSATAINRHALPVLKLLLTSLPHYTFAPILVVEQGRVAIADEAGSILKSRLSLIFIGERPGLSSPHSMGVYLTWGPKRGLNDSARNCISNIRPDGLSYASAVETISYLVRESFRRNLSGVSLKDHSGLIR